ncbi:MAG: NAD(P)-dependent oxidoreductase [Deltaproteobacteria bacterium]|nr:NAD(P)-dependent oxidoreductase [Deltaproteobacteria bacterium]
MPVKILITGATGFLGSNLLKRLVLNEACDVIVLKRKHSNLARIQGLCDKVTFFNIEETNPESLFATNHIDTIIHCATHYGRKDTKPFEVIEANFTLPLKLLHVGKEHGLRCFINTDTILDKRVNYYSLSKNQFKQWLEMYSPELVSVNMELEHFYGPQDDPSKFVSFIIEKLLNKDPQIDLTLGKQRRFFIYIDDVVEAFVKVLNASVNFSKGLYSFQVATREPVTIKQFVETIKLLTGNRTTVLNFGAIPYRRNEIMEPAIDISALEALQWSPTVSLEQGLRKTIQCMQKDARA